jgi:xanthine dehydrogenase molybdopterin-binding subunit B
MGDGIRSPGKAGACAAPPPAASRARYMCTPTVADCGYLPTSIGDVLITCRRNQTPSRVIYRSTSIGAPPLPLAVPSACCVVGVGTDASAAAVAACGGRTTL